MLARNFKSATDLRISEEEYEALIAVLGMLERGELVYAEYPNIRRTDDTKLFNMNNSGGECGTPACIGGWVAILMGRCLGTGYNSVCHYVSSCDYEKHPLQDLYWNDAALNMNATVEQAAMAVRSFLTTGKAKWKKVLRG